MAKIKSTIVSIGSIKKNPSNPRIIKDSKFDKLVKSIKEFPQMLELRPIVLNKDGMIIGGNMRYEAAKVAGMSEVPVIYATNLSEEQEKEFMIKDNLNFGEWDFDMLANDFDVDKLVDWSMDAKDFGISNPTFEFEEGEEIVGDLAQPNSDVKMVQLYFDTKTQSDFVSMVSELMEHFGTSNITDTTLKIVEYAHDKIKKEND